MHPLRARSATVAGVALLVLALLSLVLLAPTPSFARAVRERSTGPAPATMKLTILLPLRARDKALAAFARAVSTPGSPQYGAYEPISLLAHRFGAPPRERARVVRILRAQGVRALSVSPTGMFVRAVMTVAQAERIFATPLARYRGLGRDYIAPAATNAALARAAAASAPVPRALRGLVTGVIGLSTRPLASAIRPRYVSRAALAARASRASSVFGPALDPNATGPGPNQASSGYQPASGTPSGCSGAQSTQAFTPNQYLTANGFDPLRNSGLTGKGERVALIEIDGFKLGDIQTFASCFGIKLPKITVTVIGSTQAQPPGGESTLDLEVLSAAAPGLNQIEVYESNGNAAEVVDAFAAPLIAPGAKPQVLSASLGLCESDMLTSFGNAGIGSVERDVDLAASTGISLLASSGDTGSSACQDANGNPTDVLNVNYPASSPNVTAVGGTNFTLNPDNTISQQVVWNDTSQDTAAGGGGVSQLFKRPSYQRVIPGLVWRAVPDVSLLADVAPGYAIYCTANEAGCNGWTNVGGTSAASPLLAGGLALINEDLQRRGHELLGLINGLLYNIGADPGKRANVYDDVTQIGNDLGPFIQGGDGRPLNCCEASAGYDQASGWGSPKLAAFDLYALQALPTFGDLTLVIKRPQRPGAQSGLKIGLICTSGCTASAFGFVDVSGAPGFSVSADIYDFPKAGRKDVVIHFTKGQERQLITALRHHRGADAELFGIAFDARGQVAKVTAGQVLQIRG